MSGTKACRRMTKNTFDDVTVCNGDWVCLPAAAPTTTSSMGLGDSKSAVSLWLVEETAHYLDAHMPAPPPLPLLSHGDGVDSDGGGVVPPAHAFAPGVNPDLSLSESYSVVGPALLLTSEVETFLADIADNGADSGDAIAQMDVFLSALLAACPSDMTVAVVPVYTIPTSQVLLTHSVLQLYLSQL
jgi:hypothetical protein